MMALSSTMTSPASFVELPMMMPLPNTQSCAMWAFSMMRLLLPTMVFPLLAVPRWMVTFSRILLLSPISTTESSPLNFKSCGMAPITAPGKRVLPLPRRVPDNKVTLFINTLLSPTVTFLSIKQKGPISQFSPIFASGSINAKGLIFAILFFSYLFFTICAVNSASAAMVSPTKTRPAIVAMPRRRGPIIFTLKISVSPGTTLRRNFTLSIFRK